MKAGDRMDFHGVRSKKTKQKLERELEPDKAIKLPDT
jgi:hypothetical protein